MLGKKKIEEDEVRAFLGKGAEFTGKLVFEGSVRINGDFKGDIFGNGTLIIDTGAEIEADICVDAVIISGTVRGQVHGKKTIRIFGTGKVLGDMNTPLLVVEEGGFFEGTCHMPQNRVEVHTLPLEFTTAGDK